MAANPGKPSVRTDFRMLRFEGIMNDILSVKHLMSGEAGPDRGPWEEAIR
jgi:hypothetical protein